MQTGKGNVSLPGPSTSNSSVDAKLSTPSLRGILYSFSILSIMLLYYLTKNKVEDMY